MCADEVEQAEDNCFDLGQCRNRRGMRQGAMRLDQHVDRQRIDSTCALRLCFDDVDHARDISRTLGFRNRDVANLRGRFTEQQGNVIAPVRVFDVVNAHTNATGWRPGVIEQTSDHQRVFTLGANRCAIFAITGQIKRTMPFALQINGFAHHFFIAGDVLARRDHGHLRARSPQGIARMNVIA